MNTWSPVPGDARRIRVGLILLGGFVLGAAPVVRAGWGDGIAISATSAPGYVRPLNAKGQPAEESYIFMEGEYMGGNTVDGSRDRVTYEDITRMLAVNLAKQNYFPTRDIPSAHLLLRVFWGTTQTFDDPQKEFATDALNTALAAYKEAAAGNDGDADPGTLNTALDRVVTGQNSTQGAIERNADLLGYWRDLKKERQKALPSSQELTLTVELSEERYFVVIMAYDYQFMRKEKKPKLLWVTRLSMRSPGNNFIEALPALAIAGADVYGQSVDGLKRVRVKDLPGGEVKLHDLKVLGTAEPAPVPAVGK